VIQALETVHLNKYYGKHCVLHDCTLHLPIGAIVGLVGPNGAGKSTLLNISMGLIAPTSGTISVFGYDPGRQTKQMLQKVGFVSQDHPLYKMFTVREMIMLGQKLNTQWDNDLAFKRLDQLHIPLHRQVDKLSGGQQAQVALVMALAKRPELLILDEPVASLDPLARREFQKTLMDAVAESGLTVILSSHIVTDLERFCDHVVILSASQIQIASEVDHLLQSHKLLVGPSERAKSIAETHTVLTASLAERQSSLLIQTHKPILDPAWIVQDVSLEDIILAYLAQPRLEIEPQEYGKQESIR
jgi:ABC-2 type transport system ATP-binding protein